MPPGCVHGDVRPANLLASWLWSDMKSSVSANARTMAQPKSATVSVENAGSVKGLSAWALATVAIAAWGLIGGTLLLLEGLKIRRSLRAL